MDRQTFIQHAESYGSDLERWPEEVVAEAKLALANQPELTEVLKQEIGLDQLLSLYELPKVDFSALEQSILNSTIDKTTLIDRLIDWLRPEQSIWRPALAACLPILIGMILGTNLEIDDQYVLSEEIEILNSSMWDSALLDEIDFERDNNEV
jgi:hypothetical protein